MATGRFRVVLWALWFGVSLGLGYPSLNRYDPAVTGGTSDSAAYRKMVEGPADEVRPPFRSRVLVPLLSRPLHQLADGRVGTWNAVSLSLLVVNAFFCATAATLLAIVGSGVTRNAAAGLLASAVYLLNFAVSHLQLAGLVDSAEACALMVIVWALTRGAWWLLPVVAIPGALAKETFVPLACALSGGWWWVTRDPASPARLGWVAALGGAGLATVTITERVVSGSTAGPFDLLASGVSLATFVTQALAAVFSRGVAYVFFWLLPLGVWRMSKLPRPWVMGACAAAGAAVALGGYQNIGNNLGRPLFNVLGPLLSLSAAWLLVDAASGAGAPTRRTN